MRTLRIVPASLSVIQEACLKYACARTVRTAGKPPQPIEKSIAGASLLAQVIVSKWADHLPLYRQEQIFARYGVAISRKSMGGWMAQCAALLKPLYVAAKKVLFESKVIGTDDTGVKVLDRKLPFARTAPNLRTPANTLLDNAAVIHICGSRNHRMARDLTNIIGGLSADEILSLPSDQQFLLIDSTLVRPQQVRHYSDEMFKAL